MINLTKREGLPPNPPKGGLKIGPNYTPFRGKGGKKIKGGKDLYLIYAKPKRQYSGN
jgi:hypothetical protein